MKYSEVRAVMRGVIAVDGLFSGVDALRDNRNRWCVSLHEPRLDRMYDFSDYMVFARNYPLFLAQPRPQPQRYWAGPDAGLRWIEVLRVLGLVERAYPRWQVQGILQNKDARYEVTLLDAMRAAGVYVARSWAEFAHVFGGAA